MNIIAKCFEKRLLNKQTHSIQRFFLSKRWHISFANLFEICMYVMQTYIYYFIC